VVDGAFDKQSAFLLVQSCHSDDSRIGPYGPSNDPLVVPFYETSRHKLLQRFATKDFIGLKHPATCMGDLRTIAQSLTRILFFYFEPFIRIGSLLNLSGCCMRVWYRIGILCFSTKRTRKNQSLGWITNEGSAGLRYWGRADRSIRKSVRMGGTPGVRCIQTRWLVSISIPDVRRMTSRYRWFLL